MNHHPAEVLSVLAQNLQVLTQAIQTVQAALLVNLTHHDLVVIQDLFHDVQVKLKFIYDLKNLKL
jgi:hypothetical protein